MAAKRKVDNLMALAVLATVVQRPMHRYEIASIMRARGKDQDMDIKWGSLYTVVTTWPSTASWRSSGPAGRARVRNGPSTRSPTPAGRSCWTGPASCCPRRSPEHPQFAAGLSVLAVLPPDEVIELLRARLGSAGGVDRRAACGDRRACRGSAPAVPGRGRIHRGDGRGRGGLGPRAAGGADLRHLPRPRDVAGLARHRRDARRSWSNSRRGALPGLDEHQAPAAVRQHRRRDRAARRPVRSAMPHETNPATRWQPQG